MNAELRQFALYVFVLVAFVVAAALLAPPVEAADPVAWPCYGEGWAPGDVWGPGPEDIVPLDTPPCSPQITLPPTDTAS